MKMSANLLYSTSREQLLWTPRLAVWGGQDDWVVYGCRYQGAYLLQ